LFGHKTHLPIFIDPDLLPYNVEVSEGLVADLKRG
jgi:hypothetical protein